MVKLGVIGYGYWGPNIARNFLEQVGVILNGLAENRLSFSY